MANRDRYKEFEQRMGIGLLADTLLFVLYLIIAAKVLWLKILLAVAIGLISIAGLALLYMSKELLRQRSLWLSCGFFSVAVCTLVSIILAFP